MSEPVNAWQEVVYDLCFGNQLVHPKRIAHSLHKASNYLSDICRRERVDPFAVCSEILREAESWSESDPHRFRLVCAPIFSLLVQGTRWAPTYIPRELDRPVTYERLCEQTGILCEDLGGAIKALARIEADGRYNEQDDADIAEAQHKISLLCQRLGSMSLALRQRREARVKP